MNPDQRDPITGFYFSGGMPEMFMDRGWTRTGSGALAGVDTKTPPGDGAALTTPRRWLARMAYSAAALVLSIVNGGWWAR